MGFHDARIARSVNALTAANSSVYGQIREDKAISVETTYGWPAPLIRRAQQISTALFAEECGGNDLTAVQYAALDAIRVTPGLDATRLSSIIAFDRSTLGDVLERLESKGWITRTPGAADKRIKQLYLSQAGEALLTRVDPAAARVQERILAPLAPQERTMFMRLLEQLVDLHHDRARMSE